MCLCDAMREKWQQGVELLQQLDDYGDYPRAEQKWVARALSILFDSGANVLHFYHLREQLGLERGDGMQVLCQLRELVNREMANSHELAELCVLDKRLGYHCEAVGFKFFPEKLMWRIRALQKLLETEFPIVEERLKAGQAPLPFYYGRHPQAHRYVTHHEQVTAAKWEQFVFDDGRQDERTRIRMAETEDSFILQIEALGKDPVVQIDPEFRMFIPYPQVRLERNAKPCFKSARTYGFFGDRLSLETAKWNCQAQEISDGVCWTVTLSKKDFFEEEVPFRLAVTRACADGEEPSRWEKGDRYYYRLIFGWYSPDSYVFVIPESRKDI